MPDELFTQDLLSRSANAGTREVLSAYANAAANGAPPTVAMLDSAMMKRFGHAIGIMEHLPDSGFRFLHAGRQIPDNAGAALASVALAGRAVKSFPAPTRALYEKGGHGALKSTAPALILHRAPLHSPVHRWEVLFLPMAETKGGDLTLVAVFAMPVQLKHDFFRLVLDSLPNAALVVEPIAPDAPMASAEVVAGNAAAVSLLGHTQLNSLLGRKLAEAFGDADSEGSWARLAADMRPGMTARFDYNHRGITGARWFDVQISPFGAGLMLALADISGLKRMILELDHQKKSLIDEMEQRRTLEEELWALAHLDPLTGLPNRRSFREDAQAALIAAQTLKRTCAVISIDIDHFKRVNDTYGHGAGDLVLRRIADVLRASLRAEVDFAARMGGEEFAVLLPDMDLARAHAFADMLRHRVEHTIVMVGEAEIHPTISLGVAMVTATGDLDNLLDRSDRALYAAKRAGRNCVKTEGEVIQDEVTQGEVKLA